MEPKIEAVIDEYEARDAIEKKQLDELGPAAGRSVVDEFVITIGRDTGTLLSHIIKTNGYRNILEVGTSFGGGAIWLAEAARATGGRLTTVEISQKKVDFAKKMAEKAG